MPIYSLNHARSGSDRVTASTAPLSVSTSPLPGVPHCALALTDFHEVSRAVGPNRTGSKNQTNPLKRHARLVWFFMHFRGPQALRDSYDKHRSVR
jgi:hypothetical protein